MCGLYVLPDLKKTDWVSDVKNPTLHVKKKLGATGRLADLKFLYGTPDLHFELPKRSFTSIVVAVSRSLTVPSSDSV